LREREREKKKSSNLVKPYLKTNWNLGKCTMKVRKEKREVIGCQVGSK
jgi:hypothetical protein